MDSITYIAAATRTESVPNGIAYNQPCLHLTLELAAAAAQIVDQAKRAIYYGKEVDTEKMKENLQRCVMTASLLNIAVTTEIDIGQPLSQGQLDEFLSPEDGQKIELHDMDPRLLHAALGCFTESGELIESMKAQLETGVLDRVNFGEEIGDIEWYQAIGFDASGVSEAHCREKNIAKLKQRYPNKFNNFDAVNRDLSAERAILEGDTAHLLATPANAAHLERSTAQLRDVGTAAQSMLETSGLA